MQILLTEAVGTDTPVINQQLKKTFNLTLKAMTFTFEIDNHADINAPLADNYEAFDVEIDYSVSPYDPGVWTYSNGDPGYPPSGGYIEDIIVYRDGKDISNEIPERWWDIILEACYKDYEKNQ